MGMFDEYDHIQLKIGDDLFCRSFTVGDPVPIPDGLYAGYEGIVVIVGHTFVARFNELHNTWGGIVNIDINPQNPVQKAVEQFIKDKETP